MKKVIIIGLASMFSVLVAACGGTEEPKSPETSHNARQTLTASGDCSFQACGVMPSSMAQAPKVECAGNDAADCSWTESDSSRSVSYRMCQDSECPAKPEIECPADTVQASQHCGSENSGPCVWTTTCAPPRITTPCADANGCNDQPVTTIGIVCKDGSAGGFACVTDGDRCFWERNCD